MFRKWLARIPLPLRRQDREAGYDWNLSIWQMEVSLTQIFDRPLRGREFFERGVDACFNRTLPDQMSAECVDGADKRALEVGERFR